MTPVAPSGRNTCCALRMRHVSRLPDATRVVLRPSDNEVALVIERAAEDLVCVPF